MSDQAPVDSTIKKRRLSDQKRVESWKAIAKYMNRSVRTVRRWEATENLPVHRHRNKKGFSVFAYCSELDAWRQGRIDDFEETRPEEPAAAQQPAAPTKTTKLAKGVREHTMARFGRNVAVVIGVALGSALLTHYLVPPATETGDDRVSNNEQTRPDAEPWSARSIVLDIGELPASEHWSQSISRVLLLEVLAAWLDGKPPEVIYEIHKIRERLPELPAEIRDDLVAFLLDFSLSVGRVQDARELLQEVDDSRRRYELQTNILFALGDKDAMRQHLAGGDAFQDQTTPLFMAMAGMSDNATALGDALLASETGSGASNVIAAIGAVQGGDPEQARQLLDAAISELTVSDQGYYFVALDLLASLLKAEGKQAEAIRILERTEPQRENSAVNHAGLFWTMCQRQLAMLYRDVGRVEDAARIESMLRHQLKLSDEGFPLARSLDTV